MRNLSIVVIVAGLLVIGYDVYRVHLKCGCSYQVAAQKIAEAL